MDDLLSVEVPSTENKALDVHELSTAASLLDAKLLVQLGLLGLAVLTLSYWAADIILPVVFAFVMNLLFQPGMRVLARMRVPRALAALALISCIFGLIVGIGAAMSGPAASWARNFPAGSLDWKSGSRRSTNPFMRLRHSSASLIAPGEPHRHRMPLHPSNKRYSEEPSTSPANSLKLF
jgi:hypothetical protein